MPLPGVFGAMAREACTAFFTATFFAGAFFVVGLPRAGAPARGAAGFFVLDALDVLDALPALPLPLLVPVFLLATRFDLPTMGSLSLKGPPTAGVLKRIAIRRNRNLLGAAVPDHDFDGDAAATANPCPPTDQIRGQALPGGALERIPI
jgi:hypothetical protein